VSCKGEIAAPNTVEFHSPSSDPAVKPLHWNRSKLNLGGFPSANDRKVINGANLRAVAGGGTQPQPIDTEVKVVFSTGKQDVATVTIDVKP
jgi:hypothetical protein